MGGGIPKPRNPRPATEIMEEDSPSEIKTIIERAHRGKM
jgi:hypothetical protein